VADTVVEEGSLTSHISLLRKALGEDPKAQAHRDLAETRLPVRGVREAVCIPSTGQQGRSGHAGGPAIREPRRSERYDYFSEGLTEEMITELPLEPGSASE